MLSNDINYCGFIQTFILLHTRGVAINVLAASAFRVIIGFINYYLYSCKVEGSNDSIQLNTMYLLIDILCPAM